MSGSNTAEQWNRLWSNASCRLEELKFGVAKAEKSLVWSSITNALEGEKIPSLSVIEIGAGSGTVGAVFAKHGAQVTVLDYSEEALNVNTALFESLGLKQESIISDALRLPSSLMGQFDVAMSFGLAEHFEGDDRASIIKAHFDLCRPGGLVVLTVPNRYCFPYRMWKARREFFGKWHFGLEVPFSRSELLSICQSLGATECNITGSSFVASLHFVFPFARWKRSIEKRVLKNRRFDPNRIAQETTSILGAYLGYALLLVARKPSS
ncbi:MAG: class I SAM-dependent methyltransferase [Betaproteobacteria bacterium]|nr:MAG: class I SAM-dependent methyltransferase [Betaproteobacteria bacterium]